MYANADIVMMDDPISALDANVRKKIFKQVFQGLLKDKTRIETVLLKGGLNSLTQAFSEIMACSIWKAQNEKNHCKGGWNLS